MEKAKRPRLLLALQEGKKLGTGRPKPAAQRSITTSPCDPRSISRPKAVQAIPIETNHGLWLGFYIYIYAYIQRHGRNWLIDFSSYTYYVVCSDGRAGKTVPPFWRLRDRQATKTTKTAMATESSGFAAASKGSSQHPYDLWSIYC